MPLPWKKSKSGRISRFVSDFQQSPKHGGSLVVQTGFPTSLIDLFVKNRDRLKKQSSKRVNKTPAAAAAQTRRRVSSPPHPHPPPPSLSSSQRRLSLPLKLDPAFEDPSLLVSKIEESFVPTENRGDGGCNHGGGGGCCVLMVVVFKVFMVAVLALSTKKLAVGITLSAFALLFLELAVARVFTLLNICPDAQVRIDSLIEKLIGKRHKEKLEEEEEETTWTYDRRNKVSFEIVEEPREEIRVDLSSSDSNSSILEKTKPVAEEKEVQTIRDVVFKNEKSKSAKLKSKIVKKIVPKKLRSYKKKRKMKNKEKEEGVIELEVEVEEDGSVTEMSSSSSYERLESESSERDDVSSNPPLLEEEEQGQEIGSKGDLTKMIGLIGIALVGLLCGRIFAIGLTLSSCLILRVFCCKSRTSL